jgi:hypothetical protein
MRGSFGRAVQRCWACADAGIECIVTASWMWRSANRSNACVHATAADAEFAFALRPCANMCLCAEHTRALARDTLVICAQCSATQLTTPTSQLTGHRR